MLPEVTTMIYIRGGIDVCLSRLHHMEAGVQEASTHSRGWAAVTWKWHSALQAWTPGVTWSVTWCYLECYLVLPGVTWALLGVT